jgi:phage gp46-like protein
MTGLLIRGSEGCAPDPFLLWDSLHIDVEGGTDFVCDWRLAAPPNNVLNAGGLQSIAALGTAVYLALFTDAFCPSDHPLAYLAGSDNRGYWGDGVDVETDQGEGPLGSLLWLLERAPLVAAGTPIERWAETLAMAALLPLKVQGAVARIVTSAGVNVEFDRVELSVQLYGSDGAVKFDRKFGLVWRQLR